MNKLPLAKRVMTLNALCEGMSMRAITDKLWSLEDIAERIEAGRPKPGPRGPYKKRATA